MHPSAAHKTTVIENGADFDDFAELRHRPDERFTIVHAGSFFGHRTPRPFLEAVRELVDRRPELRERLLRAVHRRPAAGGPRVSPPASASTASWEETGFLPYRDSIAAQRAADALLLLIPVAGGRGDTVLSGKVFEYIASRRPILAAVPPDGDRRQPAARQRRRRGRADPTTWRRSRRPGAADRPLGATAACRTSSIRADVRDRLSRRSRARDLADVLRRAAG